MALLEVSQVDFIYRTGFWLRPAQVLHSVTLTVPRGSVFGFLGANGAGKTTLIQLIVGIRSPTRGSVKLNGLDTASIEARRRIGFLPERPYFYDHLTGEQLLKYFGALSGMAQGPIEERIPLVLETVGMTHARKLELKRYSKGMLQRIGIAQAILHDPEFLVLDEPMSGLDPLGRKEIRELILRLAQGGKTIFFSSHVIPDVEAICDQVAVIEKGRLLGCGTIDSLMPRHTLGTEVRCAGIPRSELTDIPGLQVTREAADGISARVDDPDAINSILGALLSRRAKILSVTPLRPSLESFFSKELP